MANLDIFLTVSGACLFVLFAAFWRPLLAVFRAPSNAATGNPFLVLACWGLALPAILLQALEAFPIPIGRYLVQALICAIAVGAAVGMVIAYTRGELTAAAGRLWRARAVVGALLFGTFYVLAAVRFTY